MKAITEETVAAWETYLSRALPCTIISKDRAMEMQAIAAAFDAIRIAGVKVPSGKDFLDSWATTIGTHIYLPRASHGALSRFLLLVHEAQHVRQFLQGGLGLVGGPGMWWLYLIEEDARVVYEVEARTAEMEVMYSLGLRVPPLEDMVAPMEAGYALSDKAILHVRSALEQAATSAFKGIRTTFMGALAHRWLTETA